MQKIELILFMIIRLIVFFITSQLLLITNDLSLLVQILAGVLVVCYYCLGEKRIEYRVVGLNRINIKNGLFFKIYSLVLEVGVYFLLLFMSVIDQQMYIILFFLFDYLFELIVGVSLLDLITFTRKYEEEFDAFEI